MLQRTVNFVQGHVTVSVESAFPERVLNLCAAHQIPFWDLRWENPLRFTFTMTGAAWRRLRREAQRLDANAWTCIGAGSAVMDLTILYPYMDTSIPVLILYGSADSFTNPEEQEELKAAFSHADYITYDGIGHNIQWEIPEQCAEDILAFIAQ